MAKLDSQSVEQMSESINLFNCKPTLVGIEHTSICEYPPLYPIRNVHIHFCINSGQCFVDFSKAYIVTQFSLLKKEGDFFVPIKNTDPVSFIQGFGATFIRNVKVLFNKRQVYSGNEMYSYNAYLKRRLNINTKIFTQDYQAAGYFEDGLTQMSGEGFDSRRALFHDGKTFKTACSLDVDIFQQKKLFLNDLVVDIEIIPHDSDFALISTGNDEYKYEILDCKLFVKQYLLNPELYNSIQENLNKGVMAKYNYTRNLVNHYFISPGRMEFETALFKDKLPKRVFAGLVDARAFYGEAGRSPFSFEPHYLESIQIRADGCRIPSSAYKINWNENNYIRAYKDLSDITEHGISLAKYETHSAFYGFDLQIEQHNEILGLQHTGSTYISLNFSVPVPTNGLQLIIYAEFDSILALNANRNIVEAISI